MPSEADRDTSLSGTDRLVKAWSVHAMHVVPTPAKVSPPDRASRGDVVIVHGMVVASRGVRPLAEALARRGWAVHVPDLPGFGRSDKPRHALDVEGLADAAAAWMETAGLAGAPVIGNSFGTQVAAAVADIHPHLVGRLVLLSPTVDPRLRRWVPVGRLGAGKPGGRPGSGPPARARARLRDRLIPPENRLSRPSLRRLILSEYAAAGPARALSTYRHCLRDDLSLRLGSIRCPTAVVRGRDDGVVSPDWARSLAARLARGSFHEVPGADHDGQYLAAGAVADVLAPLLECPGRG